MDNNLASMTYFRGLATWIIRFTGFYHCNGERTVKMVSHMGQSHVSDARKGRDLGSRTGRRWKQHVIGLQTFRFFSSFLVWPVSINKI